MPDEMKRLRTALERAADMLTDAAESLRDMGNSLKARKAFAEAKHIDRLLAEPVDGETCEQGV